MGDAESALIDSTRHQPDYDRCGWGTSWGCKEHLPEGGPAHLVCNAAKPENANDNGHRMFHSECFEQVAPFTQPYSRRLVVHE